MNECKNYIDTSSLSVAPIIHAGVLVDRIRRVTEELNDGEKGGFRSGWVCVDKILTLKQ